ncbi:MAG: zinc-binding alcohol dehydrogenase family protein [Candidatus Sulfotelmatobacter sp.]
MNAAVLHTLGQPPRCEPFPDPVPGAGEVLVEVRAAALKPVDKQMAGGSHYASYRSLPVVCGTDGAGVLEDGTRVFFAMPRAPYGAMAQRTVVARPRCFPLPAEIDDDTAAAVLNPGLSAWGALVWRAQLAPGETVLVLGATGVTGKLAIQTAKLLGAKRIVAAGRNQRILASLHDLGADATISLDQPHPDLVAAFARVAGQTGFDVILDYVWGPPTEALLAAITRQDMRPSATRTRLVQVGESAGGTVPLAAAVLRSTRLEILGAGTGSAPTAPETWLEAMQQLLDRVAQGKLRIESERVLLADVETAWQREQQGRRFVIVP